ncbi:MAG: hypothetical protein M3024_05085 [Candidatus Dormibacteraeota bacterium]|nr:hypothetical protein [Candidatus Dormibacteraeota bacterium]
MGRFTDRATKVLTLAQEEAESSGHNYIGTEHVLLGLLLVEEGLAARALRNLGVEIGPVRETIASVLRRNELIKVERIVPTSRVKKVLELSVKEAERMGHTFVGTEHLLLGLLIEGEGIAAHVLDDLGANLGMVRSEIDRLLRDPTQGTVLAASGGTAPGVEPRRKRGPHPPYERFTERAKRVLTLAQEEAESSHHSYIGTEHLMVGLLLEKEGLAAQVLTRLGVEIGPVRQTLDKVLGRSEQIKVHQIIPTSRVKKVIEIAFEEARRLGADHVDTEHLLLGLLIEGEGIAA